MKNRVRQLDLFGQRDFTLALLQIGLNAESGPLPYLDNAPLVKPYFVGERKNGVVGLYIDATQVEWQKEEIYKRIINDSAYIPNLLSLAATHYKKIESSLENEVTLSRNELKQFFDDIFIMWRWWAGWWWAVEALEYHNTHLEILEEIMTFRKKTEKAIPQADERIRSSVQVIYPNIGKYADVLLCDEILDGTLPSEKELHERYRHSIIIGDHIYIGKRLNEALIQNGIVLAIPLPSEHKLVDNTFTGQIAFKGKCTGTVSIVLTKTDANKFKEGSVLVASQTTPDFIHAIKKAGAIVADEGGIISHASISAREFKIPCVIGTKIATQVLKDGDLVEVDADNGIVRIIKKVE